MMKYRRMWFPISAYVGSVLIFVLMLNLVLINLKIDFLPNNINGIIILFVALLFFIDSFFISTEKKMKPKVMLYIFFWGIAFTFFSIGISMFKGINYFPIALALITFLSFGFAHNMLRYDFAIAKNFYVKVYLAVIFLFVGFIGFLS